MRKIAATILIALTSFSFLSFAYSADEDTFELEEFEINTTDDNKDRYTAKIYMSYRLIETPDLTDEVLIQI